MRVCESGPTALVLLVFASRNTPTRIASIASTRNARFEKTREGSISCMSTVADAALALYPETDGWQHIAKRVGGHPDGGSPLHLNVVTRANPDPARKDAQELTISG